MFLCIHVCSAALYVAYFWHYQSFHCFHVVPLFYCVDYLFGPTWNDLPVHLVHLLLVSSWLLSANFGDNLLQMCCWVFVSLYSCDCKVFLSLWPCNIYYCGWLFMSHYCPVYSCPPPSLCTATVHHVGRNGILLCVSMSWLVCGCLSKSAIWLFYHCHINRCLLNLGSMPLGNVLNRCVARLGNLGGDQCLSHLQQSQMYKYININLKTFCHGSFIKFYACFDLSIAFMVVRWWYSMMYPQPFEDIFKFLWYKVCVSISYYLAELSVLWKGNLAYLY